jgi:hypothetical protein
LYVELVTLARTCEPVEVWVLKVKEKHPLHLPFPTFHHHHFPLKMNCKNDADAYGDVRSRLPSVAASPCDILDW